MFKEFFRLELRQVFKQPMIYVFFLLNFLMIFGAAASDQVTIGGSVGNIHKNAPHIVLFWLSFMTFFMGLLTTTAFMNNAALRDYTYQFNQILFSTPIKKSAYFWGRFWGGYLSAVFPFLGVFLAVIIAPYMPWVDAERYGPFNGMAFVNGMLVFALPNIFFCAAILFSLANYARSTVTSFIGAVLLLVAYGIALNLISDLDDERLGMMLDPFGINTMTIVTKYWTPDEKNTQVLGLNGWMLLNRVLWVAVALVVLLINYWRFSFKEKENGRKKRGQGAEETGELKPFFSFGLQLPAANAHYSTSVTLLQLWNQFKIDFLGIVRSIPFMVILLMGLFNMGFSLANADTAFGLQQLPVTYNVIDIIRGTLYIFLVAILTFYSGTLVWKERDAQMQDLYDSLPFPTWINFVAKLFAVIGIIAVILVFAIGAGVFAQAVKGYTNFELDVYLVEFLVLDLLNFAILAVLSMSIHTLVNHKYIGFFAFIVFMLVNIFLWTVLKVSSNMLIIGSTPSYTYSDMNRWGPYIAGLAWFNLYWVLFATLVAVVASLFWVRGYGDGWAFRWQEAKRRFKAKQVRLGFAGLAVVWLATAGFVYFNAEVRNPYLTSYKGQDRQAEYEKTYKQYENIPQPRVVRVRYGIDIFPQERDVRASAEVTVRNKSNVAIDSLHFTMGTASGFKKELSIPGAKLTLNDKKLNYRIYKLQRPLAPGDSLTYKVKSDYITEGFENEVSFTQVVQNGTFFNNIDLMPLIGYQPDGELGEKNDRKKRDLPDRERMAPLQAPCGQACNNTYLSNNSDWVDVETIISTSDDQIAVAPGSLLKEWKEGKRKYFHYKLDHPSWDFYSFISASYEVAREQWNDVNIEVYYIKGHEYNVDKMLKAIRKSLQYYSANFSPYWHKQARIIEFPRYASFAQAFPGTMPYSEGIGFILDLKDPDDIDMVTYVVAHEMAHQWWAHQVCGGNVQGATMLSETFSQYSALMVMEQLYGRDKMKKFLQYEMDRYLRGRGTESRKESPLMKGENQGYIHYRKGSVVMYAMRDYIGVDAVNAAMRDFLAGWAFKEPPYPTTLDFLPYLTARTPDSLKYLLNDLFEEITLYGNRTTSASYRELPGGKYEVTMEVEVQKFKADSLGRETAVPLVGDYIDIGVLGEPAKGKKEGQVIYRERKPFRKAKETFTVIVDKKPDKAGIDPYLLLVDRIPDDNLKRVELQ